MIGIPQLHIPHYVAFQSPFQATTMLFVTCIALALAQGSASADLMCV